MEAKATMCGIVANSWRLIGENYQNYARGYLECLKNIDRNNSNNNIRS